MEMAVLDNSTNTAAAADHVDAAHGARRRAVVHTLGCRLNQAESQLMREKLMQAGYAIVPFGEEAELGIINTCTVTREADAKCRKAIRQFVARNPQAFTAVVGCYSQVSAGAIAAIQGVDLIIGNQEKLSVLDYVGLGKNTTPVVVRDRIDRDDFTIEHVGDVRFEERANLKVQDGCDFVCSFCIIPKARGRARSRDWDNTLAEARDAAARGIRELVLTGVNIGTYANSGHDIVDLVDALNEIDGLLRVRISSIEPTTVPLALLDRMADPHHSLLPYLHLPLQSGCDHVLERMRRRYTTAEYATFVAEAMRRVPDLCLGTDIMVGFTDESPEHFDETCRFFLSQPFAYAHVFPFSERNGTLAVARGGAVVDPAERRRRCAVLRRLSAHKRHEHMATNLGREKLVLIENPQAGRWPGYTEDYIRVVVEHDRGDEDLHNRLARVRIDAVGTEHAQARLLELIA